MLALTTYSFLASIHVMSVVLFLGVTFSFLFISSAARKEPPHMLFALGVSRRIQEWLVLPGIAFILGTGLYLAIDGNWHDQSDNLWLVISEAWYTLAILASVFVAYPAIKTMQSEAQKTAENPGPPSAAFMAKAKIMSKLGPALNFSVLGITFLMVAKPF